MKDEKKSSRFIQVKSLVVQFVVMTTAQTGSPAAASRLHELNIKTVTMKSRRMGENIHHGFIADGCSSEELQV